MSRVKYDLVGLDLAVLGPELQQRGARVVGRREEDLVVEEDGRRDVGRAVGGLRVAPHQLAVGRAHADRRLRGQRHDRAHALHIGDDAGGVGGGIAQVTRWSTPSCRSSCRARPCPRSRPPGVTIRFGPSTSGDSLMSHSRIAAAEVLEDVARPDDRCRRSAGGRRDRRLRTARRARSPSTVGVPRGPPPLSWSSVRPSALVQTVPAIRALQAEDDARARPACPARRGDRPGRRRVP